MRNNFVVALSVDKIQTFLTEVIHSHVQEKQTETASLKDIMSSSAQISNEFFSDVEEAFSNARDGMKELTSCSGVYIFTCTLQEEEIKKKLNDLFLKYYYSSQGQKILRYVYFKKDKKDNMAAIKEAKKRLKESNCFNQIIENNKEVLFSFLKVERNREKKGNTKKIEYSTFCKALDHLKLDENSDKEEEKSGKEKHFRIAVVKADLDRMGKMFESIKEYDKYKEISEKLNHIMSLQGLHEVANKHFKKEKKAWIFPFYVAGDDIFFAVAVENLTKGIQLCQFILDEIKNKEEELKILTMSIGVVITFSKEPIRYYLEMAESQLKNAKKAECEEFTDSYLNTKISINNLRFLDVDMYKHYTEKKKETSKNNKKNYREISRFFIWEYFIEDIKVLNRIRQDETYNQLLGTPSFFYTLLENITIKEIQEDDRKYINLVLYHLLPKYAESCDRKLAKMELILNCSIIQYLYRKKEVQNREKTKNIDKINLDITTKSQFETYLRLLLLFSDIRFQIESKTYDEYEDKKLFAIDFKSAREYLLKKLTKYLYYDILNKRSKRLVKLFAVFEKYDKLIKKNNGEEEVRKIEYMKRLPLKKSTFFKLRNIKKEDIVKSAKIIELHQDPVSYTKEAINQQNKERRKAGKAAYKLYFDSEEFYNIAKSSGAWDKNFIDSLMLLYEYNEMCMKYNDIYQNERKEQK